MGEAKNSFICLIKRTGKSYFQKNQNVGCFIRINRLCGDAGCDEAFLGDGRRRRFSPQEHVRRWWEIQGCVRNRRVGWRLFREKRKGRGSQIYQENGGGTSREEKEERRREEER